MRCNFCEIQCTCHVNPPCSFCVDHVECELCGQLVCESETEEVVNELDGDKFLCCPDCYNTRGKGAVMKPILDACCGSRMFWFDKSNPNVIFADNRLLKTTLCDGRQLIIEPDEIIDFRNMPYKDNSFKMVVFDPPHLIRAGKTSWLVQKYGILPSEWKPYIKQGFDECMRVLEPYGTLIFKWNEEQIKLKEIISTIKTQPLFGNKRSKTHWLAFMKGLESEEQP